MDTLLDITPPVLRLGLTVLAAYALGLYAAENGLLRTLRTYAVCVVASLLGVLVISAAMLAWVVLT